MKLAGAFVPGTRNPVVGLVVGFQTPAVLLGKLATHEFTHGEPSFDLSWPPARTHGTAITSRAARRAVPVRQWPPGLSLHAPRGLPELVDLRPQPSIDVRHEALTRYLRALVIAIGLTRRQRNLDRVQVVVRDS